MNVTNKKIKIGLIIDEFFGAVGTAYGGYGFLARRHIAKYLPNQDFQVDVLLGRGKHRFFSESYKVDDVDVYRLPRGKWFAKQWLKKQGEFKHEVRQFQKPYDNQQAEQISLMV